MCSIMKVAAHSHRNGLADLSLKNTLHVAGALQPRNSVLYILSSPSWKLFSVFLGPIAANETKVYNSFALATGQR